MKTLSQGLFIMRNKIVLPTITQEVLKSFSEQFQQLVVDFINYLKTNRKYSHKKKLIVSAHVHQHTMYHLATFKLTHVFEFGGHKDTEMQADVYLSDIHKLWALTKSHEPIEFSSVLPMCMLQLPTNLTMVDTNEE